MSVSTEKSKQPKLLTALLIHNIQIFTIEKFLKSQTAEIKW